VYLDEWSNGERHGEARELLHFVESLVAAIKMPAAVFVIPETVENE
jgi:hypothetical protein